MCVYITLFTHRPSLRLRMYMLSWVHSERWCGNSRALNFTLALCSQHQPAYVSRVHPKGDGPTQDILM